ncbi:MAG: hypothetical protein PQJ46_04400, partial [Spirochaetales bacterium]|nr:hypothetical protein [Spirochaetales bacterium]
MSNAQNFKKAKFSLSYKLTLYFVIFGIIIGYCSFIFAITYNSRKLLKDFTESVITQTKLSEEGLLLSETEILEKIKQLSEPIIRQISLINDIYVYINTGTDNSENNWHIYSIMIN